MLKLQPHAMRNIPSFSWWFLLIPICISENRLYILENQDKALGCVNSSHTARRRDSRNLAFTFYLVTAHTYYVAS